MLITLCAFHLQGRDPTDDPYVLITLCASYLQGRDPTDYLQDRDPTN